MLSKDVDMQNKKLRFEIVGATGMVGKEMLRVLEESSLDVSELVLWASDRSAGETMSFRSKTLTVRKLDQESFARSQTHFSLFATSAALSAEFVPMAASRQSICIDNSSHFRLMPEIPLVVPEVNPDAIDEARERGIIANPNCSTIQLVVCLKPIDQAAKLKRVIVSSYQSVSGAGADALAELEDQLRSSFEKTTSEPRVFSRKIALNCIPQIDVFLENGMTKEEMKIILESRKILSLPDLRITATTVRVPVRVGHSESVNVETEQSLSPEKLRELLRQAPGIIVQDDPSRSEYPTPQEVAGRHEVFVGRIRRDESAPHSMHLWIVADNLRKGAATNAVQIAQLCLSRHFLRWHE
jgi:aspartate-semialdehyde dehydrogenase